VDTASLGRSLGSLELYLGFGAGKIRSQGGDEKFVAELLRCAMRWTTCSA
jgi:hypothetical protein